MRAGVGPGRRMFDRRVVYIRYICNCTCPIIRNTDALCTPQTESIFALTGTLSGIMYIRYLWQNLPSYVRSDMLHLMYCIKGHVQGYCMSSSFILGDFIY